MQIGVVCSKFNRDLVEKLYEGAKSEFDKNSIQIKVIEWVSGSGEIPLACQFLIEKHKLDGILACGVVIRGETSHYASLCRILEQGLIHLQMSYSFPVIFSILLVENREQAQERTGGQKGHRGTEGAQALISMLNLKSKKS